MVYNVLHYMYTQGVLASKHIVCTPLSFANRRFTLFTTSSSSAIIVNFLITEMIKIRKLETHNTHTYTFSLYIKIDIIMPVIIMNYEDWCGFTCLFAK